MHYQRFVSRILCLSAAVLSGCLPAQLDKYRNQSHRLKPTAEAPGNGQAGPGETQVQGNQMTGQAPPSAPARASIYALDQQTFRFTVRDAEVWEAALTVLMRNYNPTIVDRGSGIISTEWDSFFLNGAAYRNKISLRMVRSGMNSVDLSIHNNVERLRDAAQAGGTIATVGAVWLRSSDPANEVARILQNMAIILGQAPPVLPPNSAVARSVDLDSGAVSR